MESKNANANGDTISVRKLNNVNFFFWKFVKIELINERHMLFFYKNVMIAQRQIPHIVHLTNQH